MFIPTQPNIQYVLIFVHQNSAMEEFFKGKQGRALDLLFGKLLFDLCQADSDVFLTFPTLPGAADEIDRMETLVAKNVA